MFSFPVWVNIYLMFHFSSVDFTQGISFLYEKTLYVGQHILYSQKCGSEWPLVNIPLSVTVNWVLLLSADKPGRPPVLAFIHKNIKKSAFSFQSVWVMLYPWKRRERLATHYVSCSCCVGLLTVTVSEGDQVHRKHFKLFYKYLTL